MPKRKRSSRGFKRRTKRVFKRKRNVIRSLKNPFPPSAIVKLKYADQVAITPTVGVTAGTIYRANGAFDPYQPAGGHQPMGFDEYMALYTNFTVMGSKISVTFSNGSDDITQGPMVCGLSLKETTTKEVINYTVRESPKTVWTVISAGDGGPTVRTKSMNFSLRKFFKKGVNDDLFQGSDSADPSKQAYFHIWAHAANSGATTPAQIWCQVTINYIIKFTGLRTLQSS